MEGIQRRSLSSFYIGDPPGVVTDVLSYAQNPLLDSAAAREGNAGHSTGATRSTCCLMHIHLLGPPVVVTVVLSCAQIPLEGNAAAREGHKELPTAAT